MAVQLFEFRFSLSSYLASDLNAHRILLNVGDLFVFHPELYHCGDAYEHSNLRIHYYVFAQPSLICCAKNQCKRT